MRVGIGYDIHELVEGCDLVLGGVKIPYHLGLLGDSDADIIVHALIDALLGAIAAGDIGVQFGVGEPELMGISSMVLLNRCVEFLHSKGFAINNADVSVVVELPKLSNYIQQMRQNIADSLMVEAEMVSIKATTAKGLGIIGTNQAMAAYAVVSVNTRAGR
ncbi:2-C-methyl-D-erythritol 2,4-cyclodiphosphate synthase [Candidatus Desantisbacteria bacterium CG2_30_40_21]|uniref:2-C-methyl-D-erythritol 2,4-cyclodiphosphate synthase n=1 Tax=Candidatus Desantisbacteria bacterium CG2_30_40_21 TaxID=1817895 RepID=A0A1J5E1L7_9BACT|nr:MAG: 2-C-methyl-D-erythritol 2,4-cyclodiphosphate synthase [Candidatus Desantisbacteria bacterium CG2_30_40_21]